MINLAPFYKLRLDLTDENVIVLSGINGVGKTTILSHVVDAFYELAKGAYHNEFEHAANKYYRISSGIFSLDNSTASIVYFRFHDNEGMCFDYVDVRGKCSQDTYDEQIELDGKIPFETIKNDLERSGNIKHWSISDNKAIALLFENNLMTYFPAYRYETPSYLNDPYKLNLSFSTARIGRRNQKIGDNQGCACNPNHERQLSVNRARDVLILTIQRSNQFLRTSINRDADHRHDDRQRQHQPRGEVCSEKRSRFI